MAVEPLCLDDELVKQCDEIRAIASKNWLNSAHVSLQHLDQIKTSVYNVGLHDANDLKATNLSARGQRSHSYTDLTADPPLSKVSLQRNAWGSNGSIPDLLNQQSYRSYGSRPESAKSASRRSRPPSAKKTRPQSAKESQLPPRPPAIGIKGAKYDPSSRPPKFTYQHGGVGWVGPPAGMKFADEQKENESLRSTGASPPPPPTGTPVPAFLGEESQMGDIQQEIHINLPPADGDMFADNDEAGKVHLSYTHGHPPAELQTFHVEKQKPVPEPIHLSLPTMDDLIDDDDNCEDSDLDTDRLIQEAERQTPSSHLTESSHVTSSHGKHDKSKVNHIDKTEGDYFIQEDESDIYEPELSLYREDCTGEWSDEDDSFDNRDDLRSKSHAMDRMSVKFSEDKNVTIDITPRNQGHKVSEIDYSKRKNSKSKLSIEDKIKMQQLNSALSVQSSSQIENAKHNSRIPAGMCDESRRTTTLKSSHLGDMVTKKSQSELSSGKNLEHVHRCERIQSQERPKSATKVSNRSATPITTVMVAYGDTDDKKDKSKPRRQTKLREKDVVTMVQQTVCSDSDLDEKSPDEGQQEDGITPDKLEPWMPTKCVSGPIKNYFELSRQTPTNSTSKHIMGDNLDSTPVYKTTKTIEFDECKPKETSIKSIIDSNQLLVNKDREKFVGIPEGATDRNRKSTRSANDGVHTQPLSDRGDPRSVGKISSEEIGRPSSRAGFVAVAPDKPTGKKMLRRPLSAVKQNRPASATTKTKPEVNISTFSFDTATEKKLVKEDVKSDTERQREQVIENLINKHLKKQPAKRPGSPDVSTEISSPRNESLLLGNGDILFPSQDDKQIPRSGEKQEPSSTDVHPASLGDGQENVKEKVLTSPQTSNQDKVKDSAKETTVKNVELHLANNSFHSKMAPSHKHYASYSRGRVKSAPVRRQTEPKIRYTKPLYLNTNKEEDEVITEVDIETHLLHNKLAENGVHIRPEALERALYPPSGRTTYYQINATLPKKSSLNLLSHPKVWLPVEYKQLRLAEKNLEKANEIMRRQKLIEERKARLAEESAVGKKKKKKGKKGKKKGTLRRSNSFT